ncbi:MAG: cysteine--tRNA ligase [Candidatus Pacebacteria bacterium]|nr:cysteine--tRNA ligase [Candidatus Paceibacterota bacterium]
MDIKIYNTMSRSKETFKPLENGRVGFYQCGPTVYWTQHLGNMRAVVLADLIVRSLRYAGYDVTFARNYTDVGHMTSDEDTGEDKMEKGVKREGLSPSEIANKYVAVYEQDVTDLNTLSPDFKPRATENIDGIIEMTQTLLDKGYAYTTPLAVYFDVSKAKDYTRLSRQKMEDTIKGAGGGEVEDPDKRHSADFALWIFKAGKHKNALQFWTSPFRSPLVSGGEGFPGWHIECSVMSKKHLGATLDIHMGGIEHIPVHHTNEIAQSESANDAPYVNYWIHNEHLLVNNAKMSKSEGTSYSLAEVKEKRYNLLALRYFFLQAHYRSKQNFTWEALDAAQKGLDNLYKQISILGSKKGAVNEEFKKEFVEALADDFNTPKALALVSKLFKSDIANADKLATILDFDKVFGLKIKEVAQEMSQEKDIPEEIQNLVTERETARQNKDWAESDKLRDEILVKGYEVLDTQTGPKIVKK